MRSGEASTLSESLSTRFNSLDWDVRTMVKQTSTEWFSLRKVIKSLRVSQQQRAQRGLGLVLNVFNSNSIECQGYTSTHTPRDSVSVSVQGCCSTVWCRIMNVHGHFPSLVSKFRWNHSHFESLPREMRGSEKSQSPCLLYPRLKSTFA